MLPESRYLRPTTVHEALALATDVTGDARLMAGGTDLLVELKTGARAAPSAIIDLKAIPGLSGIRDCGPAGLRIGALTTVRELETSSLVCTRYPALGEAAQALGSVQIRNRATLGGNLCRAAPSADMAPPLLVLDAEVTIAGERGQRTLPLEQFFLAPGQTVLGRGELLTEIRIPPPRAQAGSCYQKLGPRRAMDLAVVGVAVSLTTEDSVCRAVRIALGAVAPTPRRARSAERMVEAMAVAQLPWQEISRAAAADAAPIDDVRASAAYRLAMIAVLVRRALAEAIEQAAASARHAA